ncbi:MAG TPA: SRPBCC family protein, partial [Mycobacterium sp.]|nr:SRPBCC family protein [Mycobacterium sp.]
NHWHYQLTPTADGTDVTESFRLASSPLTTLYFWVFGGFLRKRRNIRDMTKTLERIKEAAEAV